MVSFIIPPRYTSNASLLPSGGAAPGGVGFVAGWIPDILGTFSSENNISSFLFPSILKSEDVILDVCNTQFEADINGVKIRSTPAKFWRWKTNEDIVDNFLRKSKVKYSMETGITKLSFTTKYPELSKVIVDIWLEKLDLFVQEKLSSEARANYEYMLQRKKESVLDVQQAEEKLRKFILKNRNFQQDPLTNLEYQRYQSEWQIKQNTLELVMKDLEKSKLKMETGIPSVRVLSTPKVPTKKSYPKRKLIIVFSFAVSFFIAVFIVLLRENIIRNLDYYKEIIKTIRLPE